MPLLAACESKIEAHQFDMKPAQLITKSVWAVLLIAFARSQNERSSDGAR